MVVIIINTKKQKTMNIDRNFKEKGWELTASLYLGILLGYRLYEEKDFNTHVIYLPFINLALEIDK